MFDAEHGYWVQPRVSLWVLLAYSIAGVVAMGLSTGWMDGVLLSLVTGLLPMAVWGAQSAWRMRDGPTQTLELHGDSVLLDGRAVEVNELRVDWVSTGGGGEVGLVVDIGDGPQLFATPQARTIAQAYEAQGGPLSTSTDPFVRQIVPGVLAQETGTGEVLRWLGACLLLVVGILAGGAAATTLGLRYVGSAAILAFMAACPVLIASFWKREGWLTLGPQGLTAGEAQVPWSSVESIEPHPSTKGPSLFQVVVRLADGRILTATLFDEATRDEVLHTLRTAREMSLAPARDAVPTSLRAMRGTEPPASD